MELAWIHTEENDSIAKHVLDR